MGRPISASPVTGRPSAATRGGVIEADGGAGLVDVTAPDASAVAAYAALRPAHRRLYGMVGEFFRQF